MPKTYAAGDEVAAADYNQIVKSAGVYATDAGGDDTYAITVAPVPTTYADGDEYTFKPSTANTGACTLNVNSLGAVTIKKFSSGGKVDLSTGDIIAGQPCRVKHDGTDFILISAHQPRPLYATGQASKTSGSTGTQNIAHGLGVIPRLVKISYFANPDFSNAPEHVVGVGTATSTSDETCSYAESVDSSDDIVGQQTGLMVYMVATGGGASMQATLSALDATNITLDWTVAAGTHACYFQWEAFA